VQAANSSVSDWHDIDPFLFQHFTVRGTFLDVWGGLRSLCRPVQKQLMVAGVSWSGRNPLLVVKIKLNQTHGKNKKQIQSPIRTMD